MRGVVGNLWGIVSIAHSVKSDDVEDVGGKGMCGAGRREVRVGGGRGVYRPVSLQRRAKIYRCCSFSPTNVSRRFAAWWWVAEHVPKWARE